MCTEYMYRINSISFVDNYQIIHIYKSARRRPGQWIQDCSNSCGHTHYLIRLSHEPPPPFSRRKGDGQPVLD
jgi:hypothetical protein